MTIPLKRKPCRIVLTAEEKRYWLKRWNRCGPKRRAIEGFWFIMSGYFKAKELDASEREYRSRVRVRR